MNNNSLAHNQHIWRGYFQLDNILHRVIACTHDQALVPTANWGAVICPTGKPQKNALAGLWNVCFKGIDPESSHALETFAKHNTQTVHQIQCVDDDNLFIFGHYDGTNYLCVGVHLAVENPHKQAVPNNDPVKWAGQLLIATTNTDFIMPCALTSYVEQDKLPMGSRLTLEHKQLCYLDKVPDSVKTSNALRIRTTDIHGKPTSYVRYEQLAKKAIALNIAWVIRDAYGTGGCVVYGLHQADSCELVLVCCSHLDWLDKKEKRKRNKSLSVARKSRAIPTKKRSRKRTTTEVEISNDGKTPGRKNYQPQIDFSQILAASVDFSSESLFSETSWTTPAF